jgi:hypothetical protein
VSAVSGPTREEQFPVIAIWPRYAMKIPADSLRPTHPGPVPALSQSRYGDIACETLYVHKHVHCTRVGESEPAARGIEIHQVLAAYINHLARTKRGTDLEVFDALMKGAGTEA